MYIERLSLQHIKLIKALELDFLNIDDFVDEHKRHHRAGEPRMWTVLIGKNGRGKSAILQSIALAACGSGTLNTFGIAEQFPPRHIAGPFDAPPRLFDQLPHPSGSLIEAQFRLGPALTLVASAKKQPRLIKRQLPDNLSADLTCLQSWVQLAPKSALFTGGSRLVEPNTLAQLNTSPDPLASARSAQYAHWLVAGYGVARQLQLTTSRPTFKHHHTERLEPLFATPKALTGLGFADYFEAKTRTTFNKILNDVIRATSELFPELGRLELRGAGSIRTSSDFMEKDKIAVNLPSGQEMKLPATLLSHGYQSSLAWVADMIGQFLLDDPEVKQAADLSGLVLIDELDLHLHPTWQTTFISALRKTFPRVQFIATTHSPLVLSSLRPEEVVVLELDEQDNVEARTDKSDPRLRTIGELAGEFFEIHKLYPQSLADKHREYTTLATDPYRTDAEDKRAHQLKRELERADLSHLPLAHREAIPPMDTWPSEEG